MQQLISKKSFPYGGIRVNPGESFAATNKDAALLVAVKYADYQTDQIPTPPEKKASLAPAKPVKEKKTIYKKENMVAERSSTPRGDGKAKPKRQYKRRDLKADD